MLETKERCQINNSTVQPSSENMHQPQIHRVLALTIKGVTLRGNRSGQIVVDLVVTDEQIDRVISKILEQRQERTAAFYTTIRT